MRFYDDDDDDDWDYEFGPMVVWLDNTAPREVSSINTRRKSIIIRKK